MDAIITVRFASPNGRGAMFHNEFITAKAGEIVDRVNQYIYDYVNDIGYHHIPADNFHIELTNRTTGWTESWNYRPTYR